MTDLERKLIEELKAARETIWDYATRLYHHPDERLAAKNSLTRIDAVLKEFE